MTQMMEIGRVGPTCFACDAFADYRNPMYWHLGLNTEYWYPFRLAQMKVHMETVVAWPKIGIYGCRSNCRGTYNFKEVDKTAIRAREDLSQKTATR